MLHNYFVIQPHYCDSDLFCHFMIGSGRINTSIQIVSDLEMLTNVAHALVYDENLTNELDFGYDEMLFDLNIYVKHSHTYRDVVFQIYQSMLEDHAPYRAEIIFQLNQKQAHELSSDLILWLNNPTYRMAWKS